MHREKARWEFHKNATSYLEQNLEATPPPKKQLYSHLISMERFLKVWKRWKSEEKPEQSKLEQR